MDQNSIDRFGSSDFASEAEIAAAGYFRRTSDSVLIGFFGSRPLWYSGLGGILLQAGARSGKFLDWIGYLACGVGCEDHNIVALDVKGEFSSVGRGATSPPKHKIMSNPTGMHGLPRHRINPVDYLRIDSPTLVSDTKMFCANAISQSGSANGQYFEQRARGEFLEAMVLTIVRRDGVLTLSALYESINLIPASGQAWLDFAFEMHESGFPISARIEEEIANARNDSSGGYQGILGELFKAFSCFSDPLLLDSVSSPFDFSYEELTDTDKRYAVSLLVRPEHVGPWSLALKAHFVAARIYKSRAPQSPRQTWCLDECATLASGDSKGFPLIPALFSVDAGLGIRPICVVQTGKQLDALAPNGQTIVTASAAVQCRFAVRDLESATELSNRLGAQTLLYDDELAQGRARRSANAALNRMFEGDGSLSPMIDFAHHSREARMQTKQMRLLRTPAEILHMPPDKQIIHADGLPHPIYADRKHYTEQRFMAGRFHPNPFYPPLDRVRVKTWLGHATLRVIEEPVALEFADFPQFGGGTWSRIEKRKWWQL